MNRNFTVIIIVIKHNNEIYVVVLFLFWVFFFVLRTIFSFGRQDLFYIFYPCAKMTSINVMFTPQRKRKIPVCFDNI